MQRRDVVGGKNIRGLIGSDIPILAFRPAALGDSLSFARIAKVAVTTYGTNDPLAVKLWAKVLEAEALKACWIYRFIGNSSDDMIQVKDETQKSAGDQITYGLRMQLAGNGTLGDGVLEGNEEALTTFSDAIVINQLRHASPEWRLAA